MATKIPLGTTAYFTDFAGGQGGGAGTYVTYADDLDTNFLLLRQTINQMIDEVSAVSGPNATVALNLALWDDDANPITTPSQSSGVLGAASYEVSVVSGTLTIRKGQVMVLGQKGTLISDLTGVTSSGGAGTRWVAVDSNGGVFIESAAGQRALDIATVTWDGAQFTAGTVTHLADVFFDGDSWAEIRRRAATGGGGVLAAFTYRRGANRIRALERLLAGFNTGAEGEALAGPIALLPGAAATPSLILGNGTSVWDTGTGWFRPSTNTWGFSAGAAQIFSIQASGFLFNVGGSAASPILRQSGSGGIYFPTTSTVAMVAGGTEVLRAAAAQALLTPLGTASLPALAWVGDPDTGVYSPTANEWAVSLGGTLRFHLTGQQALHSDGAVGAPAISFLNDPDTGVYRSAANEMNLVTGGTARLVAAATGELDFPTQPRVKTSKAAAQNIASSATPTVLNFDTEAYDVGAWHDNATNNDRHTVPTGGDGSYTGFAWVTFDESTSSSPNTGDREVQVTVNGTVVSATRVAAVGAGDTKIAVPFEVDLVATDIVRATAAQDSGGTMDVIAVFAVRKAA